MSTGIHFVMMIIGVSTIMITSVSTSCVVKGLGQFDIRFISREFLFPTGERGLHL